jgi:ketosteroid isomerase-like protein
MGNSHPLEVAMDFIKRVNSGDVHALCELMTEGHIFQDALGKRFIGRETIRQGWAMYFKLVADYQVHAEEFFQTGDRLAIFGTASGRYVGAGAAKENFWEVPASWLAVVQGGLLAEWRVYADNQPLRRLRGDNVP